MYMFWITVAIVTTFLATVYYYEYKIVNLELEIDRLKRELPAPLPFNVLEFKPESGTRYERELMADINAEARADGYGWPAQPDATPGVDRW